MSNPSVNIRVFGALRVEVDGTAVGVGARTQRVVLMRLLIARRRVVSTDLLIEDLWANDPPPRALASLQVYVSNLRRVLEPARPSRSPAAVVVSAPPGYLLDLPDDAVDVWDFERRVIDNRPADALKLWTDLPYREVADAPWIAGELDRLADLRRTATEREAAVLLARGSHGSAIAVLEPNVRESLGREESVRLLALALYRSGRQTDALAVLRRCRVHLAEDLGLDVGPALQSLESDILSHNDIGVADVAVTPSPDPVAHPEPSARRDERSTGLPRTNGRPRELARSMDLALCVLGGGMSVNWIRGEAGEGKTTLARLLAHALSERSWRVGWGRCPEIDGAPPGWAWREILAALDDTAPMDDATRMRLSPIMSDDLPNSVPVQSFSIARAVADYLSAISRSTPLLVVLDDVHRADTTTMSIVRYLAATDLGTGAVHLVATYRASETTDDLRAAWATLHDTRSAQIELAGLDRPHLVTLAAEHGLSRPTSVQVDLLAQRTGGNPLFVRELARLMASEGRSSGRGEVPTGIADVLRRRLSRLPERTLTVLRMASILGRAVDVDTLRDALDIGDDDLLDAVEPAVLAGLLVETDRDTVRFAHVLVLDTLYADLPRLRRTRMHARVFAVLSARRPDDMAALARHAAEGATGHTAAKLVPTIVAAARRAESLGSHRDALELWHSALATSEMSGELDRRGRLDLLVALVPSLARAADTENARARRNEAIEIATSLGETGPLVAALSSWQAPVIWHIRGMTADRVVLDPLERLLADSNTDDHTRAALMATAVFEIEGLDSAQASTYAESAVRIADSLADPMLTRVALNAFGYVAFGPDHDDGRRPRAHQLLAVATEHGMAEYQALAHFQLYLAAMSAADLTGARRHLSDSLRCASGAALTQLLGVLALFDAVVDLIAGRFDSGRTRYDAVADYLDAEGTSHGTEIRELGRMSVAIATDTLDTLVTDLERLDHDMPVYLRPAWVLGLIRAGDLDRARELWADDRPAPRDYYWRAMTVLRATAAASLRDLEVCRSCYDELLPFAGTFAGVDSGSLFCGPVDTALAAVASALGREDDADGHRRGAADLLARTEAALAAWS
ncbi:ATPase AAA [Rhodococcoides trifolii]|uniref:ATPase AAA n=1 Tax=Rhodococcoides trifolii TaxID=908250 RepID=A0A917FW76_9NOCA|nr:BTAD domain-containing putative transcriptional regulator [Rhodococcus trifolii]GGG06502.1 ATPase AAA [Rhodococcus trifolii]